MELRGSHACGRQQPQGGEVEVVVQAGGGEVELRLWRLWRLGPAHGRTAVQVRLWLWGCAVLQTLGWVVKGG